MNTHEMLSTAIDVAGITFFTGFVFGVVVVMFLVAVWVWQEVITKC